MSFPESPCVRMAVERLPQADHGPRDPLPVKGHIMGHEPNAGRRRRRRFPLRPGSAAVRNSEGCGHPQTQTPTRNLPLAARSGEPGEPGATSGVSVGLRPCIFCAERASERASADRKSRVEFHSQASAALHTPHVPAGPPFPTFAAAPAGGIFIGSIRL